MATAATMQAIHIRPGPVAIAPSPSTRNTLSPSSAAQPNQNKTITINDRSNSRVQSLQQGPCDGCKRRNNRCAMNERAGKCYSCEFHRQDCVFTSSRSRKRSFDETIEGPQVPTGSAQNRLRTSPAEPKKPATSTNASGNTSTAPLANTLQREDGHQEEKRTCRYIGTTTDLELSLLESLPSEELPILEDGRFRVERFDSNTFMEMLPDLRQHTKASQTGDLESLVEPQQDALIEAYLEIVNPSFPILSEQDISNLRSNHAALDPVLLAAVYLLATKSRHLTSWETVGKLEDISSNMLQESLVQPQLSTVQAGLIMAQCWSINSSLLNMQLNAAAFDLGLHQDCSSWNISASQKGLRKRLAWCLYAHDKWTALATGRPSFITSANWTVLSLTPNDFETQDSTIPTYELFTSYITLSTLLSSVLDTFYTLASAQMVSPQQILSLAKPVQLRLKEWYSQLPSCLKMDNTIANPGNDVSSPGRSFPTTSGSQGLAFLHLAYFTTEILLHRRIIRSLSPSAPPSQQQPKASYSPLHHICRLAAKTRLISSLEFCNRLRSCHLTAFWPVTSRTQFAMIGSFGTLLLTTSPTKEEEQFYLARLREFRWTLGVCSPPSPPRDAFGLGGNGEDVLGFGEALSKLDLGLELWEKGQQLRGGNNRSVKDVAEEMKRAQIYDPPLVQQPVVNGNTISSMEEKDGDVDFEDESMASEEAYE